MSNKRKTISFEDHFSSHSQQYAQYRPKYPDELYTYLASLAPARSLAWNCGTGNGQAALGLAKHFDVVDPAKPLLQSSGLSFKRHLGKMKIIPSGFSSAISKANLNSFCTYLSFDTDLVERLTIMHLNCLMLFLFRDPNPGLREVFPHPAKHPSNLQPSAFYITCEQ
jgi:hypothetical protein